MPEEALWQSFFDTEQVMRALQCAPSGHEAVAEFGSGYGTFTLPLARLTTGLVHAFDIEPELVTLVRNEAAELGLGNIRATLRDFLTDGTGLAEASVQHAMLYNILHIEHPERLLPEAARIFAPGGTLSILHWQPDPTTPRGPPMEIRPTPGQSRHWAEQAGFRFLQAPDLSTCAPWHYGLILQRP